MSRHSDRKEPSWVRAPMPGVRPGKLLGMACLAMALALAPFGASADPASEIEELRQLLRDAQDSMRRMIEEHQQQIDTLKARIDELEERSEGVRESQEELRSEIVEQEVATNQLESSLFGRISIHGYYDFQYLAADSGIVDSFVQNELAVYLRHESEDEVWTFFSELEFEIFEDESFYFGDRDGDSEFEIETAWLEYRLRDALRVRAGKLLLPQYWQTYHYPNLTLSTRPPAMVGAIFPKDIIGVQLRGDIWFASERGVSYVIYVGNGGDSEIAAVDTNDDKAVGGRLTAHLARGERMDTFDLSISGYAGRDETDESEQVLGFDTQIRIGKFELLSEVAFGDQFVTPPTVARAEPRVSSNTEGYYVQAAYNVRPRWHLFYRFDELELLDGGAGDFDSEQHTLGVNFRPRPNLSLKFEVFRAILEGKHDAFNGLATSVAYNF